MRTRGKDENMEICMIPSLLWKGFQDGNIELVILEFHVFDNMLC